MGGAHGHLLAVVTMRSCLESGLGVPGVALARAGWLLLSGGSVVAGVVGMAAGVTSSLERGASRGERRAT